VQFPDRIGKATVEAILKHFDGEDVAPEQLIPSELYYKEDAENDPALKE
jgi:ribose transport system substrate-binding protein